MIDSNSSFEFDFKKSPQYPIKVKKVFDYEYLLLRTAREMLLIFPAMLFLLILLDGKVVLTMFILFMDLAVAFIVSLPFIYYHMSRTHFKFRSKDGEHGFIYEGKYNPERIQDIIKDRYVIVNKK